MNRARSTVQFVNRNVSEYKKFVGIETFPEFQLIEKNISLDETEEKGFTSLANDTYNFLTGKHELTVSNLVTQYHDDPVIYHELTHILDERTFCKGDKAKYVKNGGYSEFHASQIETMKALGANHIDEELHFSMEKKIKSFWKMETIREFMMAPYNSAQEIINYNNFPSDFQSLSALLGLLFNYWGRRSICILNASDYNSEDTRLDMSIFSNFFSVNGINPVIEDWNDSLFGWLNAQQVEKLGEQYAFILVYFRNKYKLQ